MEVPTAAEIDARREAAGLSRAEMCRLSDTSYSTLTRWIAGATDVRLGTVRRWLEVIEQAERTRCLSSP